MILIKTYILATQHHDFIKMKAEGNGVIVPTWTEVDPNNVLSLSELWNSLHNHGWNIQVCLLIFSVVLTPINLASTTGNAPST